MLCLFQYGKQHIDIAQRYKEVPIEPDEHEEEEEDSGGGGAGENVTKHSLKPGTLVKNNSMVISRENLILLPDPEMNYNGNNNLAVPNNHHNDQVHILFYLHIYNGPFHWYAYEHNQIQQRRNCENRLSVKGINRLLYKSY